MKKELDDKLCQDFPNLYADRNASCMSTCMCWGFECGDGWYNLIRDLSEKLEVEILTMPVKERENCKASQVKEKFGQLRMYLDGGTDKMYALIDQAEDASGKICEECGQPGKVRGKGWLYCSCNDHAKPEDRD